MKIVIDIPEQYYNVLKSIDDEKCYMDMLLIKHGTPYEERKTGKWLHLPNVWGVVFCSECNYDLRINDTKYCPNCGAEMEVDE